MTEAQKFKFYFPAWNACVRANGWRMQQGQLVIDPERLTEEGSKVHALARQRALATRHSPLVTLDDMRHGAHILALKRDKSSEHLTNAEVDRVVCLFRLLKDPDDLDAVMQWQAYERGEDPGAAKRVDWFIKNAAPDAYIRAISEDKFGSRQWEWLESGQKAELARTLSERRRAKLKSIVQRPQSILKNAQPELVATGKGPKVYQMNPHKVYTKGPF